MRSARDFIKVYIYSLPVDMRKQIKGLTTMVSAELDLDVFSENQLYVFCNRRRKLIKCVYWDKTGFAMWVKQLEEEKFPWPRRLQDKTVTVTPQEFQWLLQGIDLWKMKRHRKLEYSRLY